MRAWILRQEAPGIGMVREVYDGRPIVTASVDEAERYPTREAAEAAMVGWADGLVRMVSVEVDVGERRLRGEIR